MAILLDRLTTAASERADPRRAPEPGAHAADRTGRSSSLAIAHRGRRILVGRHVLGDRVPRGIAFSFRGRRERRGRHGSHQRHVVTEAIKNVVTFGLINPIQGVLTSAPWWLVTPSSSGSPLFVSGRRPAIVAGICLAASSALQVWEHGMETLAQVLVATALTLAVGLSSASRRRAATGSRRSCGRSSTRPRRCPRSST